MISGIKALRFKMAMALLSRRSWALYSVIGILFLAVIAYMCMSHRGTKNLEAEIEPLKEFKADMDRNIESAKREARWAVCFRLPNLANTWQNNLKWRIDRVATTNEPLAVELRTLTEKMSVLGRRSEKLSDEIEGLREQAYEKREKGLDDEQEFKQASKLLMERKKTDAETEEIYNEILRRIGEK